MLEQPYFGRRLKALRLERGLSQATLADGILSTGHLSRLESGSRSPTPSLVGQLCARLKVTESVFDAERAGSLADVLAAVTSAELEDDTADRLAAALREDGGGASALHWQALWLLARMRGDQGQYDAQRTLLVELATLTEELGQPVLRARVRTQLSRCVRLLGDSTLAQEYAAQACAVEGELSLSDRLAALHALVSAEAEAGRLVEAREHADQLCRLAANAPGTAPAKASWAWATVCIRQGAYTQAHDALDKALRDLDGRHDLDLWMRLRLAAASLLLQMTPPRTDEARTWLDQVEPALGLVGTERHQQEMGFLRTQLAFQDGRFAEARELLATVDADRLSFREQIRLRSLEGHLQIMDGRTEEGVAVLQRLAQQAHEAHNVELAADIWRRLAELLANLRDDTA
jgi:transcriptional regulator with XRE-family HTH domain